MWIHCGNGESAKPPVKEVSGDQVIVRKAFELIPADGEFPEHWEYDEWQMTKEAYEVYTYYEALTNEQSDALMELAELIAEVI